MTDCEVEMLFCEYAAKAAAPIFRERYVADIVATVWEHGKDSAEKRLRRDGVPDEQVNRVVAQFRKRLGIIGSDQIFDIGGDLRGEIHAQLHSDLHELYSNEPELLLEERIGFISEFMVQMFSNEPQHRGRPHVKVKLPDGAVTISLDDPPEILAGSSNRGEARAKKVIAAFRRRLLERWKELRPDDQGFGDE